jgi:hypothetical protein
VRLRTVLINCIAAASVSLYSHTSVRAQETVIAGYSTNRNTETTISGPSQQTSTIPTGGMPASGGTTAIVGNSHNSGGALHRGQMQRVYVSSGAITGLQVRHSGNNGSPIGDITVELQSGTSEQNSGTVIASATYVPVASQVNSVNLTSSNLNAGWYWLVFRSTASQASPSRWTLSLSAYPSPYADGFTVEYDPTNGTAITTRVNDLNFVLTLSTSRTRVAQSFYVSLPSFVSTAQIFAKRTGAVTGTLTAGIYTNNAGRPSNVLVESTAEASALEAEISDSSHQWISFVFSELVELDPGNYWLVIESNRTETLANYIAWGADSNAGYIQGETWTEAGGTWTFQSRDSVFQLLGSNDTGVSAYTEAITLDSGQTAAAIYTLTAGDLIIKDFLLVLIGINVLAFFAQIFGLFRRGR